MNGTLIEVEKSTIDMYSNSVSATITSERRNGDGPQNDEAPSFIGRDANDLCFEVHAQVVHPVRENAKCPRRARIFWLCRR